MLKGLCGDMFHIDCGAHGRMAVSLPIQCHKLANFPRVRTKRERAEYLERSLGMLRAPKKNKNI